MKISVVIPTFNRVHTLKRSLDSIYRQTSPVDEVIVVNDGSTDSTQQLIEKHYPQVHLINQPNKGVSAARNTGLVEAKYEWIALLDSDDEWLEDKIKTVREIQTQHPQDVLFHSDEIWIRHGKRVNPMHKHRKSGGFIFSQCLPLCVISPSAAIIHQSIFNQIGGFDETLPACEDYDLWLRLCHLYPVVYIDNPLIIKYGGHADQLSRQHWGMDRFRIQALHSLLKLSSLSDEQRQLARDMLIKKSRILLKGARKHNNHQILDTFSPLLDQHEAEAC